MKEANRRMIVLIGSSCSFGKNMQVEHFEDQLDCTQQFITIHDKNIPEPAPYVSNLLFRILKNALVKHSKRSSTFEV